MKFKAMIACVVVAVAMAGCSRINPGHVGIKVINGGSDRGVQDFPTQIGWVFYNPVTTSIFEYPTYVQTAVWTKNTAEGRPLNEEISFTNKDRMLISVDVNASYHLEGDKVPQFYVKFRSDDINSFTYGYFRNTARDAFNEHAGRYNIDQIMGDNAQFLKDVKEGLQKEVSAFGVVIDQFGIIGAPRPPQVVIDQINASVHATQLTTQKQNELAQVLADAAKVVGKSEGDAKATLVWADAQATANRKIADSITPTLVQYKALEKWNGVLPTITGSGAVPFVNVERK
jgi:regulator of protease activity HflC (stomatin/prohibitin superfamily)